jgi:hypothetical protein
MHIQLYTLRTKSLTNTSVLVLVTEMGSIVFPPWFSVFQAPVQGLALDVPLSTASIWGHANLLRRPPSKSGRKMCRRASPAELFSKSPQKESKNERGQWQ